MKPMSPGLDRGLSKMYQRPPWLASKTSRPRWTTAKQVTSCDECFARQHESRGLYGPRARVAATRTMPDGTRLYLCSAHADLWRELDEKTKPQKGRAKR